MSTANGTPEIPAEPAVLTELIGSVLLITLNRPAARDPATDQGVRMRGRSLLKPVEKEMVRPARFERATYRFVVCCSIQLS